MQTCQVCGKENPAGVEYCEDCGAALGGGSPSASAGTAAPASSATPASQATDVTPAPATPQSIPVSSPGDGSASGATASSGTTGGGASGAPAAPEATGGGASATDAAPPASAPPAPSAGDSSAPAPAPSASAPSGAPAGQRARLVIKRFGAPTGDEIPLLGERLMVGRFDPETGPVDIDLSSAPEAEHISRQHGELYREADGRWFVRDLGSTNGVFVKGQAATSFGPRITAPQPLANGDEVAFGNARFLFRTD